MTYANRTNTSLIIGGDTALPLAEVEENSDPDRRLRRSLMLLPITLALNPTSALKDGGYRIEGMQVDAAPVDVKGIRCTRLHLKGNSRTVTSTLDADREHGWIPIQWRVVANRRTTLEVALEYDLSESAPRLKNWVLTTHGGGFNSWKGRMLRLEVNQRVDDRKFEISFPIGTHIAKKDGEETSHYVQEIEDLRPIDAKDFGRLQAADVNPPSG